MRGTIVGECIAAAFGPSSSIAIMVAPHTDLHTGSRIDAEIVPRIDPRIDAQVDSRNDPDAARIQIIAPSGALLAPERFERALAFLRARGFHVCCDVPATGWQRFSAPDEERLAQIDRAARRRDIGAVMITRGGYGLSRLLERIDWSRVAASVADGVRWIGYSDFTAFQLALLARSGAPSFAGPGVSGDLGAEVPDPFMLASFDALMRGRLLPVRWPRSRLAVPRLSADADPVAGVGPPAGADRSAEADHSASAMPPIEGLLWGGNLSMLASAVGTTFLPHVEEGILFLEDVGEHPYRIERMLYQLLHAGVLEAQRAIVLGRFTEWTPAPHDDGYDLQAVVEQFRQRIAVPIVTDLPFGHVARKAVLGIGRRYRLSVDGADWLLAPLDPCANHRSTSRTQNAAPGASSSSLKS